MEVGGEDYPLILVGPMACLLICLFITFGDPPGNRKIPKRDKIRKIRESLLYNQWSYGGN